MAVNIKKAQLLYRADIRLAAEKVASTEIIASLLTERGYIVRLQQSGVVDTRGLSDVGASGWPVVFDATHSVQLPGAAGTVSGGQPEFIEPLASAAVATGVDAVFIEVPQRPGARVIRWRQRAAWLDKLPRLWCQIQRISSAA